MRKSRRNFYRVLFVQPEAPPEVIRAVYRALMQTLRTHPDLGGSEEEAALINEAYAVLRDPVMRREYDRGVLPLLRRARAPCAPVATASSGRTGESGPHTGAIRQPGGCAFCRAPLPSKVQARTRCRDCESPLAPPAAAEGREPAGRRTAARVAKNQPVLVQLAPHGSMYRAALRDMSLAGLSLRIPSALRPGQVLRVCAPDFEAVARVVGYRPEQDQRVVHAKVLAMLVTREAGVLVQTSA